jgi:signal transduction histidine kinase
MTEINLAILPCLLVEGGSPVDLPPGADVTIGRDEDCALELDDENVSRRHARVWREGNRCFIEDLKSQNGTFVNDQKLEGQRTLADGDVIRMGNQRLRYAQDEVPRVPPIIVKDLDPGVENLVEPNGSEEAVRGQVSRLRSVLAIAEGLAVQTDVLAVARHVLGEVLRMVHGERGLILAVDGEALKPLASLFADGTEDQDTPYSRTILRMVTDQKKALLTQDALADGRLRHGLNGKPVSSIQIIGQRSVLAVPMIFRDRLIGILQVSTSAAKAFGFEELRLLMGVARIAALAFVSARANSERARLIDELTQTQVHLRSRVEQFRLLYQLEHQVATTQDLGLFLTSVARQAVASLGGSAGAIFLVDEDTGRITFAYPAGGKESELKHQTFEPGRGFVGHVISTGQSVLENDPTSSPHFDRELAQQFGLVPKSILAVPLVIADERATKVIGALEVLDKKEGPFTAGDQQLLTFLAAQIGSALLRMRLQDERSKRERLATIGTMAASIAHDFGTPLQIVSGYIEILETKDVQPEHRGKMLRGMRTNLDRIANMVNEVLEFARGLSSFRPAVVPAREFFADIAAALEPEVKSGRIQLDLKIDYEGELKIDAERMRRVVFNLVNNALAAMDADRGGTLTLSCHAAPDDTVELEVADTGPGIAPEIRPRLFAPFATYGKKGGTGLGLSIAQRIVKAHGGSISVEDNKPRGTRFVIRVPA